jgi:hypothetical protein
MNNRRKILYWSLWMGALGFAGIFPSLLAAMIKPDVRRLRGDVQINGVTPELR